MTITENNESRTVGTDRAVQTIPKNIEPDISSKSINQSTQ